MVGKFRTHKAISHNGAVYGYSSSLVFLPQPKIGVVVLSNEDIANARIQKLANLGTFPFVGSQERRKTAAEASPGFSFSRELAQLLR